MRQAIRPSQEILADENPRVRNLAAVALGAIGPDKTLVPALVEALKDESSEVRYWAATALRDSAAKEAAPALLALVKQAPLATRREALTLLGQVKPASKEVVSELIRIVKHETDLDLYSRAVTALGDIGPSAKDAIPALVEALKNESWPFQQGVIRAVGAFGQDARPAVPALLKALNDDNPEIRVYAAASLWQIERRSERVLPVVLAALQGSPSTPQSDGDNVAMRVPGHGASALSDLPAPVLPANFNYVHVLALKVLCQVEPKTGYPLLCKAIQAKESDSRLSAILTAGELGPEAKEAVPALIQVLRDKNDWHVQAAQSLGQIGRAAASALPAFREAAKEDDPFVRRAAHSAIKLVSGES
jgi:HEAT repeat protein